MLLYLHGILIVDSHHDFRVFSPQPSVIGIGSVYMSVSDCILLVLVQ